MKPVCFTKYVRLLGHRATLLIIFGLFLCGCKAKEPPLSPAAAAFKKEVAAELNKLSPLLIEPVAHKSTAQINVALQKFFSDPQNAGPLWPYKIVVTDKSGVAMGKYPVEKGYAMDFSNYSVVQKCLQDCKTTYGRLFSAKGAKFYIICSPILKGDEPTGILALGLDGADVDRKWHLTEKEFLALDFDR